MLQINYLLCCPLILSDSQFAWGGEASLRGQGKDKAGSLCLLPVPGPATLLDIVHLIRFSFAFEELSNLEESRAQSDTGMEGNRKGTTSEDHPPKPLSHRGQ